MRFLWHVHRGDVTEVAHEELEAARHAHHAAYAEAQMVASLAVLTELDSVGDELSEGYRKTKCLQEDHPVPGGSFEEIQVDLNLLWERYRRMRSVMRRDLQINDPPLTSPADPS